MSTETNSTKITELNEVTTGDSGNSWYFVIADNQKSTNNKIGYSKLKDKILSDTKALELYTPEDINQFATIDIEGKKQALSHIGGKLLYEALQNRLKINDGNQATVSTPTIFNKLQVENTPSDAKDVVNLSYLQNNIINNLKFEKLFIDYEIDYIYGNEIHTIVGLPLKFDKTDASNWKVTDKLPEKDRNNETGWQSINKSQTIIQFKEGKRLSDYKKILIIVADEDGNTQPEKDLQYIIQEYDVGKYKFLMEQYKQRLWVYNNASKASSKEPVTINVCGQQITWTQKLCSKNYQDYLLIQPNYYYANNGGWDDRSINILYTQDYETSINLYGASAFLVSIIGLK